MKEYSLENLYEKINNSKSKSYFAEVLSSYHNENYRSAIVMLWSVVVCDVFFKLQDLSQIYGDSSANSILESIKNTKARNEKSSVWEMDIINKVYKDTGLLNSVEYEKLKYIQKIRHLSSHPTLDENGQLFLPSKEEVRALLRNALTSATFDFRRSDIRFYTSA